MKDNEIPTEAEQGLYLVTELSWFLERASLKNWPQRQADLFRVRLRQICAAARLQSPTIQQAPPANQSRPFCPPRPAARVFF
jgi:hypothetical protein